MILAKPKKDNPRLLNSLVLFLAFVVLFYSSLSQGLTTTDPLISKIKPEEAQGRGFKMVYSVDAELDVYWNYRTDFDNQLLLRNKFIDSHRLINLDGNVAVTETEYATKPGVVFRWKTTAYPEQNILKYELLNAQESGQSYHYGSIQLETDGRGTRVTHVSYFDFFGVSLWVNYPFRGGMSQFLKYTAKWEQHLISEFAFQYQE